MNHQFAAVRDATPIRQRFPVVIAAVDGGSANLAALGEALARRGYVVITNAAPASIAATQVTNPAAAIDSRIRDLEYLSDVARRTDFADADRLAVIGVNFDGMPALLYQMKNMRAAAVVSIDGWEGKFGSIATVRASPFFEPRRMRVPYFLVLQDEPVAPPGLALDLSVFDQMKYGSAEHLVIRGLSHAFLVGSGSLFPGVPEDKRAARDLLIDRVVRFIDSSLGAYSVAAAPADSSLHENRGPSCCAQSGARCGRGRTNCDG